MEIAFLEELFGFGTYYTCIARLAHGRKDGTVTIYSAYCSPTFSVIYQNVQKLCFQKKRFFELRNVGSGIAW